MACTLQQLLLERPARNQFNAVLQQHQIPRKTLEPSRQILLDDAYCEEDGIFTTRDNFGVNVIYDVAIHDFQQLLEEIYAVCTFYEAQKHGQNLNVMDMFF